MRELSLDILKAQIPERDFDRAYANSRLLIAYPREGTARSLWNLTLAAMDAEVDDFASIYRMAEESRDLAHFCGFHGFRWKKSKWHELRLFWSLVYYDPTLIGLKIKLREYMEHVCENSRTRFGNSTKPIGLLPDGFLGQRDGFNPMLPWRDAEWLLKRREQTRRRMLAYQPLTEFYPYIAKQPTDEHALLLAVDRAVGQRLPVEWRGDFCQDLLVSILCGELSADNLSDEIPNYLKKFKREMPNKYKEISIDALLFSENGGSGKTLADYLVAKPEDDLTDEDIYRTPMTGRYGKAIADCETAEDFAERLSGAWEANRLLDEKPRFASSPSPNGRAGADPETERYRRKYSLTNNYRTVKAVERPRDKYQWSVETARPDELREERSDNDTHRGATECCVASNTNREVYS